MDPVALEKLGLVAEHLGVITLVLAILGAGAKGVWVYGTTAKERLAEKDGQIREMTAKLAAQERLIDRLSGLAERSTDLARPVIVHDIQEHQRRHRRAVSDE